MEIFVKTKREAMLNITHQTLQFFCRCCLTEMHQNHRQNINSLDHHIRRWLQDATIQNIHPKNGFSNFVCRSCKDKLEDMLEFRKMCARSRRRVTNLLQKEVTKGLKVFQSEQGLRKKNVLSTDTQKRVVEELYGMDWSEFDTTTSSNSSKYSSKITVTDRPDSFNYFDESNFNEISIDIPKKETANNVSFISFTSGDSKIVKVRNALSERDAKEKFSHKQNENEEKCCKGKSLHSLNSAGKFKSCQCFTCEHNKKYCDHNRLGMEKSLQNILNKALQHNFNDCDREMENCNSNGTYKSSVLSSAASYLPKSEPSACYEEPPKKRLCFKVEEQEESPSNITNECPYCGVAKKSNQDISSQIDDQKQKQWPCTKCSFVFNTLKNLTLHDRVVHTDLICKNCKRELNKKNNPPSSGKESNSNSALYVCIQCDKQFKQLTALRTHSKTHKEHLNKHKSSPEVTA